MLFKLKQSNPTIIKLVHLSTQRSPTINLATTDSTNNSVYKNQSARHVSRAKAVQCEKHIIALWPYRATRHFTRDTRCWQMQIQTIKWDEFDYRSHCNRLHTSRWCGPVYSSASSVSKSKHILYMNHSQSSNLVIEASYIWKEYSSF